MPIEKGDCFIVKYSPDGMEQWIHEIHLDECNFPGGIAIDQNDNIIITGGSGIWSMNMYYWVIKMNNTGIEQWNHTFHESAIDLGLTIYIDYVNNIVVSGFSSTPFVDNVFIIKYSENGKILWEKRREGNQPWEVAIDSQNNVIVVGTGYSGGKITMLTIKNDKDGNLLWTREFDSGGEADGAYCVDVDSNDNIFVSGLSSFSKYDYYEHCTIIYDPEGNEICVKRPGIEGFIHGIAIDSTDNVIVTGTILEGINGYYTTKYNDIAPPEIQLKKPKDHHLHIFNIPLIKLKKCTIFIGKLIVLLDSGSPSNIDCIEIYLDDILKTKLYDPPFEWTWSEKTFGKHKLNIMIYDDTGSAERFEISFWQLI
jgi:outer membrane protein assembly factor BamB